MDKDNKFNQALLILRRLCEFIAGEDHRVDGQVKQFKFGVSQSVVAVRAFCDHPDTGDLDTRTGSLYSAVKGYGDVSLKVRVFHAGTTYGWDYTPRGAASSVAPDDRVPEGVLLRVDIEGKGDDFLKDRAAFREAVGPFVTVLLDRESTHPNVFFNAETCDFD